jgi:hypothetical protein
MTDEGEFWRDVKAASQAKRASNRQSSADMLKAAGVAFVEANAGAHLIVQTQAGLIDFWPGTGLWIWRGRKERHGGVRKLLAAVRTANGTTEATP